MKILFCTNQVNTHGGIERILCQKINSLIQDFGHEVMLLTFDQKNQNSVYELNKNVISEDLNINYHAGVSYFHPKNLIHALQHFLKLKKSIKKFKPEIIISISYTPDQYFLPFISKKIPKIKELHASGIVVGEIALTGNKFAIFFKKKLIQIFKKYDKLIVLNKDEIQYFEDYNTIVIPNFTDFSILKELIREKTIIAAGRIAEVKNFEELAVIWSKIHLKFPDWQVKIFGNGSQQSIKKLKQKIDILGISNSFFLLPSTKNIQEEFQKSELYVMTSLNECFPMVLLEAQVCGLPIVSYDCPNGPRNIINDNDDGFLIPIHDTNDFAEKLSLLMTRKDLRAEMSRKSKKNVLKFNKNDIMSDWNKLFKSLINK